MKQVISQQKIVQLQDVNKKKIYVVICDDIVYKLNQDVNGLWCWLCAEDSCSYFNEGVNTIQQAISLHLDRDRKVWELDDTNEYEEWLKDWNESKKS